MVEFRSVYKINYLIRNGPDLIGRQKNGTQSKSKSI